MYKNSIKTLERFSLLLFLVLLGLLIVYPVGIMHSDPANGLRVFISMERGAAFNTIRSVDIENLSLDQESFLTWWSPGQYLFPYCFAILLGVNMGVSLKITIVLFTCLFYWGTIRLFRYWGFQDHIIFWSLIILLLQRSVILSFWSYEGGETLLIGGLPWLLLLWFKNQNKSLLTRLTIGICIAWVGTLLKLTFLVIFIGFLLFLFVHDFLQKNKRSIPAILQSTITPALIGIISLASIYVFFLSKGETPGTFLGCNFTPLKISIPLAAPFAMFSIDLLLRFVIGEAQLPTVFVYILLFGVSIYLMRQLWFTANLKTSYKHLLLSIWLIFVVYFWLGFSCGTISTEFRHLRMLGYLTLPFLVHYCAISKHVLFSLFLGGLFFVNSAYGIFSFYKYKLPVIQNPVVGRRGFDFNGLGEMKLDRPTLQKIQQLDDAAGASRNVFITFMPEISLEPNKMRCLLANEHLLKVKQIPGQVNKLYVLVQKQEVDIQISESFIAKFKDYENADTIFQSTQFFIFELTPKPSLL